MSIKVGRTLLHYRIIEKIGEGGSILRIAQRILAEEARGLPPISLPLGRMMSGAASR